METAEEFWNSIDVCSADECWNWKRGLFRTGYGQAHFQKKTWISSRLAWTLSFGPIPAGLLVCHTCDNRKCCNPMHLFLGTIQDNLRDRDAKQRQATANRNGTHTHPERVPRGARHPSAKLTHDQVSEIRSLYASGVYQRELAERFGVSQLHISRIVRNLYWRD